MDIQFQFPQLLVLLLVVVPVVFYIQRGYALRESMLAHFLGRKINKGLIPFLVSICSFCILGSLIIIASGPKRVLNSGEQNLTGSYVFMIDVSRSMAARQICNDENRLDRARNIISSIIMDIPEAKFGFMGVAGLTFVLSEMSFDRQYIFDVLNHGIFIEVVPMPGSDLANALHVFLEKKNGNPPVYDSVEQVILFSDGDITDQELQSLNEVFPLLVESGVVVTSVGMGEEEGVPIPTLDANRQCLAGQYERADGKEFYTHLLDSPLITIAENTEGKYFYESQEDDLITHLRSFLRRQPDGLPPAQTEDIRLPFLILLLLSLFCLFLIKRL